MISVRNAGLSDYFMISKTVKRIKTNDFNCYSEFNGCIIKFVLKKECFIIIKNSIPAGILFIKRSKQEIAYVPIEKDMISFFRLLYILNKHFALEGYYLNLKYKNFNMNNYKKYFHLDIVENYKHMHLSIDPASFIGINTDEDINVRRLQIFREENIRVELQNRIFGELKGRVDLTLGEVYEEERKNSFLKDMCFILCVNQSPSGYGQIVLIDSKYYLVNFGIIPEYRSKGYGNYFLNHIISHCLSRGIEDLYLCVDSNNNNAINLYSKAGFQDYYNSLVINFK
jgi:ribosomal protein S18 acetylase RimI-like enzyme